MVLNARSLRNRLLGFLCGVLALGMQIETAHAQSADGVRLEGQIAYRFTRMGRGPWDVSVSASRVVNYGYDGRSGLRALLILSPKGYRPGTKLKGLLAAQTNLGYLEARTAYTGIAFSGQTSVKPGRYVPVLAIVDENNLIEHAVNFPKKASFKTRSMPFARSARSLKIENIESLETIAE